MIVGSKSRRDAILPPTNKTMRPKNELAGRKSEGALRQIMIIPIDENNRICGTESCWEIQRHRNYKGGKRREPHKWFTTFRQALEEAVHHEIRIHPAHGLSESILAVADVVQKYEELIPSK